MGNSNSQSKEKENRKPSQSTNPAVYQRAPECFRRDSERTGTVTKTDVSCDSKHSPPRAGHGHINPQQSVNLVPNPGIREDTPSMPRCHQLEPGSSVLHPNDDRPNFGADVERHRRNPDVHSKLHTNCEMYRHEARFSTQSPPSGSQFVGTEPSAVFSEKPDHSQGVSMRQKCEWHPLSNFSDKTALVATSSTSGGINSTEAPRTSAFSQDVCNPKHLTKPSVDKFKPLLSCSPHNSSLTSTTSALLIEDVSSGETAPSPWDPDLGRSTNEWQATAFSDSASITSGLPMTSLQGNVSGSDANSLMTLFGIEQERDYLGSRDDEYEAVSRVCLNRDYSESAHTGKCASKTSSSSFNGASNKASSLWNDDVLGAKALTLGATNVDTCNVLELPRSRADQIKRQDSPASILEDLGASGLASPPPRNDVTEPDDDVYSKTEILRPRPANNDAFQMTDGCAKTYFVVTSSLENDLCATRCVEHSQSDGTKASSMKSRPEKCDLTDPNYNYNSGALGTVQLSLVVNDDPGDENTDCNNSDEVNQSLMVAKVLSDSPGSVTFSGLRTSSTYDRKDASLATHEEPKKGGTCDDVVGAEASTLGATNVEKCNVLGLPRSRADQIKRQDSPASILEASGLASPPPRNDGCTEPDDDIYSETEIWRPRPANLYAFQVTDGCARTDDDPGDESTDCNNSDEVNQSLMVAKVLSDSPGSVTFSGFRTSSTYDRNDVSLATHEEPKKGGTCDDMKIWQTKVHRQLTLDNCTTTVMTPSTAQNVISRTEGVHQNRKGICKSDICTQPQVGEEEPQTLQLSGASGELLAESAGSRSSDEESCGSEDLSLQESSHDMHQTRPDNALDDGASTTSESDVDSCEDYTVHETRKSNLQTSCPSTSSTSSTQFTNDLSRPSVGLCDIPIECINITSHSEENISSKSTHVSDPDGGENGREEKLLNHMSHNFSPRSKRVLSAGNAGRGKHECLDPLGDNAHDGSKFGRETRKGSLRDGRTSVQNSCSTSKRSKTNHPKDVFDKSQGKGTTKQRRKAGTPPSANDDNAAAKVLGGNCHEPGGGKPKKQSRNRPPSYKRKQKAKDIKGLSEEFRSKTGPRTPSASSTSPFGRRTSQRLPSTATTAHDAKPCELTKGKFSRCPTDSPDVGACRVKTHKGTTSEPNSDIPSRESQDPNLEPTLDYFIESVERRRVEVLREHEKKIEEVDARLAKSKPKKKGKKPTYQPLDNLYERRKLEEHALEQRKSELEDQGREFQNAFDDYIIALSSGGCLPKKCLQQLQSNFERECHRLENALPIYGRKTAIVEQVRRSQVSIVIGETGSGKSTQMVQYLYEAGFAATGVIACTQPRKVAASSLSTHVGQEMGSKQLVGCQVGAQYHKNTLTKIMYTTDHALLNECLKDRSLSRYSCIIIDEAHERSIYTDLLLGMVKRALETRPELRVIITSATIDPELFVNYFNGCPVLRVSGRMFPVDVVYSEQSKKDYLLDAVVKSYKIHTEEEQGDVLVFLTSPAEVEQACEKLKDKYRSDDLECLPLHGKLRQEDQLKVFQSYPGKRKVIFATNCAETSVTVAGVKFVVDSGKVKEMQFDPKRNMSSLVVTNVNQSSAEQRKGRAGRTQAGTCYRLYSQQEYEAMNERSAPEILRIHLGQAILKLMDMGVKDPADFDFVESPPKDSLRSATETLKALGAISNGRLTQLGWKMARVPLEPRLARLVFQGIDQNVGSEALILAAVATVNGSIFFRMGSDEEKKLADRRKVQFCQEDGDLLTLLAAYREWSAIKRAKRNTWCYDNSLNAKALRIAEDTVHELKLVLKHELRVDVKDAPAEQDASSRDETLRKILLSCYISNLCMFSGHERAGYRVVMLNQCVQLHPSSALKVLNFNPRFAVYGQLLKTSQEFLLNVTPVEEEWLEESIQESGISIDVDKLKSFSLEPETFTCSGELISQTLLRRGFKSLKEVEDEIACRSGVDSPVILEVDKSSGCVKLFAQAAHKESARVLLQERLEHGRDELRKEAKEIPVIEGCNTVRVLVARGAVVQQLLMPNKHRSIMCRRVPPEYLQSSLEMLKRFGKVVDHKLFQDQGKMIVTYDNPEAVSRVLGERNNFEFIVHPLQTEQHDARQWYCGLKVKLTWCRRRCRGTASIGFQYHEDVDEILHGLLGKSIIIKSRRVFYRPDKKFPSQLFVTRLPLDVTENDVVHAFESALPDAKANKVFLHREAEFATSQKELDEIKGNLEDIVRRSVSAEKFQVHVQEPWDKASNYVAFISFKDADEGREVVETLEMEAGGFAPITNKMTITPQLQCSLTCPKKVYTAVEGKVNEIQAICFQHCQDICRKRVLNVTKQCRGNQVVLMVKSDCMEHYIQVTAAIRKEFDGDTIDCSGDTGLDILLSSAGRDVLQGIQEKTGALIHGDHKSMFIKIYGEAANKDAAKRNISSFLKELLASGVQIWEVCLRGSDMPRGLLKAVVSRYGVDLVGFQRLEGVQSVSLDLQRHMLKIKGTPDGYEMVERCVRECAETLEREPRRSTDVPGEMECVACFCPVEGAMYRVSCCGHPYCQECVQNQLKAAQFPLKCAKDECAELFVWKDINKLAHGQEQRDLLEASIEQYVKSNPDKVKCCPTPDCEAIYAVSNEGKSFPCYVCRTDICTLCHVQYHHGLTCAEYESEKKDGGADNLLKWINEDKANRKRCPKCRKLIEKNGGCNHMRCTCGAQICWLCLEMFPNEDGFYVHQRNCSAK